MKNINCLKSALVVVGGSIAAAPASALELGEARIHSSLGQPLRASISYALGPNEGISETCVTLVPAAPGASLPSVDKGSMIIADGVIAITGSATVREPMLTLRLSVRCQYTPRLTREYLLFVDPAPPQGVAIEAPTSARLASQPQLAPPPVIRESAPVRRQPVAPTPIENGARYRVQPGDTLSTIVQRIDNRPVGLWTAVNAIFAQNPDAFLDNDPNKLKAGSWLTLPRFGAGAPAVVTTADPVIPTGDGAVYEPVEKAAGPSQRPLANLQPGDVIVGTDAVPVESVTIPDTRLEAAVTTASSPNVPVAIIRPPAAEETRGGVNWLLWLGSASLALILGLVVFGRQLLGRFGSTPVAPATPQRRSTDVPTEKVEAIAEPEYLIDDDSPTAENLALDADLIIGTGLEDGAEVDVASDFAFASTTELDIELTEEMVSDDDTAETDIIPPIAIDESSILDSEVLPENDDDEYDMSVIVDATKMPDPADVTERDLEAIAVHDDDESLITGDYTLSQEADYKIVEQDYEDELTATQALNAEIQRAAEELATRMDDDASPEDDTVEKPLATVHELDVTAPLQADENTVEMPRKGGKSG